jgi:hypothetical protein
MRLWKQSPLRRKIEREEGPRSPIKELIPNLVVLFIKIIETTSLSQVVFYVIQMGFGGFSGGNDISWATAAS